jgi:hypothetical protein
VGFVSEALVPLLVSPDMDEQEAVERSVPNMASTPATRTSVRNTVGSPRSDAGKAGC